MFEDPNEQDDSAEASARRKLDPAQRAKETAEQFRMHAELAAVFEGPRKFDAQLRTGLDADVAREVQRSVAKLEKAKSADSPVLPPGAVDDAAGVLNLAAARGLSTNDYHVYRRPGEVMIVRWLAGEQVDTFYVRLQAHFDAAMEGCKEDERQANEWRQDEKSQAYLKALDGIELQMADRYLRDPIREHNLFVLSTVAVDEMDILHLCETLMGVEPADLVGKASAPPSEPTEQDRAWFFKLFSLRGMNEGVEQMCFFTYMQKTEESW